MGVKAKREPENVRALIAKHQQAIEQRGQRGQRQLIPAATLFSRLRLRKQQT